MSGRKVFRLAAAIYAMLDAIHRLRVLLFGYPQPIEWWLLAADVAIVLLIIWIDVPELLHKRRCAKIVPLLSGCMERGRRIQDEVPEIMSSNMTQDDWDRVKAWTDSVNQWSSETDKALALHSARASACFQLVVNASSSDNIILKPNGRTFYATGGERTMYQRLLVQLDNLRGIIEKPDVYF